MITTDGLRLRFVAAREKRVVQAFINMLPYKIALRDIVYAKNEWVAWYVLPEDVDTKQHNKAQERLGLMFNGESIDFGDLGI